MKALLVGYGEVGKAIYNITTRVHTVRICDPLQGFPWDPCIERQDVLVVAIPWSEAFIPVVQGYQAAVSPGATIICSTVPVGTCRLLNATHLPVEGRHPEIHDDMMMNDANWVGDPTTVALDFIAATGLRVRLVQRSEWTEFLKLRSLAYFGLCIEFARTTEQIANRLHMPRRMPRVYDEDYNALLRKRGDGHLQRPELNPPEGKIGGHCVLPGVKILRAQYRDELLAEIERRNDVDPIPDDAIARMRKDLQWP
jgi:hypothetical protein